MSQIGGEEPLSPRNGAAKVKFFGSEFIFRGVLRFVGGDAVGGWKLWTIRREGAAIRSICGFVQGRDVHEAWG
jgi:hypothetical protein